MAMKFTFEVKADRSEEVMAAVMSQLNEAMDAVGKDASSVAANKAPVDTGALRNSITNAVTSTPTSVSAHIGTNLKSPEGAPYPLYQEVGTRYITGKHYLQFGIQAHANDYLRVIKNYLQSG